MKATSLFQTTLHPIHDFNNSQPPPNPSVQIPVKNQPHLNAPDRGRSVAGVSGSQLDVASSSNYVSATSKIPLTVYPKDEYSPTYNLLGDTPNVYTSESMADISPGPGQVQPSLSVPDVDMGLDMPTGSNIPMEFHPPFFDQSLVSAMNWLPTEVLTSGNQTQQSETSLQYSQSDSHAGPVAWQPPVIGTGQISLSQPENVAQTPSSIVPLETDLENVEEDTKFIREASSANYVDRGDKSTRFNTDGDEGPTPKAKKRDNNFPSSSLEAVSTQKSLVERTPRRFRFPVAQQIRLENVSEHLIRLLNPIETSTHKNLHAKFLQLCHNENPFFQVFDSKDFPSADECNRYMVCFFDSFQLVYPIIHPSTFDPNLCHWLLTLALVGIGCNYSGTPEALQGTVAFHEMIRRGLLAEVSITSVLPHFSSSHVFIWTGKQRKYPAFSRHGPSHVSQLHWPFTQ